MALKGNTARFAQNPRNFDAIMTAAMTNLNTDAPTGAVLLATAGAQGAIVPRLSVILRAPLLANTGIVLFRSKDGSILRPKGSVTLQSQAATTAEAMREVDFAKFSEQRPLRLGPNEQLWIGSMAPPPAGGIAAHGDIVDFIE